MIINMQNPTARMAVHFGLICVFLVVLNSCSPKPPSSQADLRTYHDIISKDFIDPSGTTFRNEYILYPETYEQGGPFLLCGEINVKNEFGGYVGYRPYYYSAEEGEVWILQDTYGTVFQDLYNGTCYKERKEFNVINL